MWCQADRASTDRLISGPTGSRAGRGCVVDSAPGCGRHAAGMAFIEVDGLIKRYGDRTVVDGVSFAVEQGEIFGILGPNGAGKTTTVECVEGLRNPDGGVIRVCGIDPQRDTGELR